MQYSGCCSIHSLLTSRHFVSSRNVFEGNARLLREQGKVKRLKKSFSLRHDETEQLWQSDQFCYHSPMALINTLCWLFTLHSGVRERQEYHNMKVEDFSFYKHDGFTCITFSERITKTRQSESLEKYRVQIPFTSCNTFLGGAPTSIYHFFRLPSVCPSVAHHISGTVHHVIIIFGTYV